VHAPTGAARWYKRLAEDFKTTKDSQVQVLDVAAMSSDNLYKYWIRKTEPGHPVLADSRRQLLKQIKATYAQSETIVVGCDGEVKLHRKAQLGEQSYSQVKDAVDKALEEESCTSTDDSDDLS
jgi:hypothetical protein